MKQYIYFFFAIILFSACGSSKYNVGNTVEDKALSAALKQLDKNPSDTAIQNQIKILYNDAAVTHLNNIEKYEQSNDIKKWDQIIKEYEILQKTYNVISSSKDAINLIKPSSFTQEIENTKQKAASELYANGIDLLNTADGNKQKYRDAYYFLKKANSYVPGYKDVKKQMSYAYENGILDVVVNPVTDQSSYYSRLGSNSFGNSFNSDMLQRSLVRDLGSDYNKASGARFYTDRDADRANKDIDWIVDITWQNLDIPYPQTNQYSRNVSKQIQVGTDTSGKAEYKTVTATLYVTRRYFTARGELECRITDAHTRNNIDLRRYSGQVDWQQEYATYQGDYRALSNQDLALLNNSNYNQSPRKEDILLEIYQRIYPQLKNGIYNLVRW